MHETYIVSQLIEAVEAQAKKHGMNKVTGLKIKVGRFRMIVPELLNDAFETMARGTQAAGAKLEIETIPLIAHCSLCGQEFEISDNVFICSGCGLPFSRIVSGQELELVEIQGEEATHP